jgi:hypothetical protein
LLRLDSLYLFRPPMPISREHGLCFIHIPKTGGSSIESALGMKRHACFWDPADRSRHGVTPQHWTLAQLRQEVPDLARLTIFTMVRNPFDRLVSEFHHIRKINHPSPYHCIDFDSFVALAFRMPERRRRPFFDAHLEPQYRFTHQPWPWRRLPVTVLRFERIAEGFDALRRLTGKNLEFPHELKSSRSRGHREYYAKPQTRRLVETFYARDLREFGYTF